jgi:hypothetical protein
MSATKNELAGPVHSRTRDNLRTRREGETIMRQSGLLRFGSIPTNRLIWMKIALASIATCMLIPNLGPAQSASGSSVGKDAHGSTHQKGRFEEPDALNFSDHDGYVSLFNGKSLKGWDGDPTYWRVEDGAIVGESTPEHPLGNTYISYHGTKAKDFDLKLEIKVEKGGGSGIQYRSRVGLPWIHPEEHQQPSNPNPNWIMTGPQADIWDPVNPQASKFSGQFYSENTNFGILAWRGEVVVSAKGLNPRLMGLIGDRTTLGGSVHLNDWNEYTIIARGGTFLHIMNGQLMSVYVDDNPDSSNNQRGLIGIELEATPTKVSVRNVWLRKIH